MTYGVAMTTHTIPVNRTYHVAAGVVMVIHRSPVPTTCIDALDSNATRSPTNNTIYELDIGSGEPFCIFWGERLV
jgi:hypothetical protein